MPKLIKCDNISVILVHILKATIFMKLFEKRDLAIKEIYGRIHALKYYVFCLYPTTHFYDFTWTASTHIFFKWRFVIACDTLIFISIIYILVICIQYKLTNTTSRKFRIMLPPCVTCIAYRSFIDIVFIINVYIWFKTL